MNKLKFYEKSHKYKIGKVELTSVTTFIGKFFEPFDARGIARKLARFPVNKAKKRGVRYWLAEWKEAAQHGTRVHELIENAIEGNQVETTRARDNTKFLDALNWWGKYQEDNEVKDCVTELRIYNEEHLLAGTIDLFILNEDGTVTLADWKTNKAIKKKGYNNKKAYEPISEWDDCNYNKYMLQLSLYAYMLELNGHVIKELIIVHLMEDKYKEYKVEYKKETIKELLNQ